MKTFLLIYLQTQLGDRITEFLFIIIVRVHTFVCVSV